MTRAGGGVGVSAFFDPATGTGGGCVVPFEPARTMVGNGVVSMR